MIGIIGAMDIEVDLLKESMENARSETVSGICFVKGMLFGKEAVVARCGVGKVNAAVCAQTMILRYAPEKIINTGVAGSLSASLDIGDAVVADFVVQGDVDTTALGDRPGFISTVNIIKIPCSDNIVRGITEAGEALGLRCISGTVATTDSFIADRQKKDYLVGQFDALACEMEGGSIGQVCYINEVEFGIVRAISDKADGSSHMDYGEFCALAAKNSAQMIEEYLKNL